MKSILSDKLFRIDDGEKYLNARIIAYINTGRSMFDRRNRKHRETKMYFNQIIKDRLVR